MKRIKKFVAAILATLMVLTSAPLSALADEITDLYPDPIYQYYVIGYVNGDKNITFGFNPDLQALYIGGKRGNVDIQGTYKYDDTYHSGEKNYLNFTITECDEESPYIIGDMYDAYCMHFEHIAILNNVTSLESIDFSKFNTDDIFFEDNSKITKIGDNVFKNCPVTDISALTELETIGDYAFYNSDLQSFVVPDNCTKIGNYAFSKSDIKTFDFPYTCDKLRQYGNYIAANCKSLNTVNVHCETLIPNYAFDNSPVNRLELPKEDVVSIGEYAFRKTNLKSVDFYKTEFVFTGAFFETPLERVTFHDNISVIEEYAFSKCNINQLEFDMSRSEGYEYCTIYRYAFSDNVNLTYIAIPGYVRDIYEYAFANCTSLAEVEFWNVVIDVDGGYVTYKTEYIDPKAFDNTQIDYEESPAVKYLNYIGNKDIVELDLSDVHGYELENFCFSGCTNLEKVILPTDIKQIPNYCFMNTPSLREVVIPEGVERIGLGAFQSSNIHSVYLPSTLKTIDKFAFAMSNLEDIELPDSVTSIGENAFESTTFLNYVKLSKSMRKIPNNAFNNSGLFSFEIPAYITSIGDNAFGGNLIKSITAEKSSTPLEISKNSFSNCKKMINIDLGGRVKNIAASSFAEMKTLTSFNFDGVETIGSFAFRYTKLTDINISSSVKSIGYSAFGYCDSLKNLHFDDGVDLTINNSAFEYCSNLNNIVFPSRVKEILKRAFSYCTSLKNVSFESKTITDGDGNEKVDKIKFIAYDAFYQSPVDKNIIADAYNDLISQDPGEFEKTLSDYEYYSYYELGAGSTVYTKDMSVIANKKYAVRIADSVTKIDDKAFADDKYLAVIIIPESVTEIGANAFDDCSSLSGIIFEGESNLSKIGKEVFCGCSALEIVYLKGKYDTLPTSAFFDCGNLKSVCLPSTVKHIGAGAFRNCTTLYDFTLPEGLVSVGSQAFSNTSISSLVIPESLTIYQDYAFADMYGLSKVVLPKSLKDIPEGMFYGNSRLTTINLDEGIKSIGANAFSKTSIPNVVIPSTVEEIGESAFSYANFDVFDMTKTELKSTSSKMFYYANIGTYKFNDELESFGTFTFMYATIGSFTVPDTIKKIGNSCFSHSDLSEITLDANLEQIGESAFRDTRIESLDMSMCTKLATIYDNAALDCTKLNKVVLPNSVEKIGVSAFSNTIITELDLSACTKLKSLGASVANKCAQLKSVKIPSNVESIGNSAFSGTAIKELDLSHCTKLTEISGAIASNVKTLSKVYLPDSIKSIGKSAFYGCSITHIDLPKSLESIDNNAFHANLIDDIILPKNVTFVGTCAFGGTKTRSYQITVLNAELEIDDGIFTNASNKNNIYRPTVIRAISNSKAHEYATENNIEFVAVDENGNALNFTMLTGSYNGGTWEIKAESTTQNVIRFIGSGNIDVSTFTDENGKPVDINALIKENIITKVVFPRNITIIPNGLFNDLKSLKEITIPDGVTTIGDHAFEGCSVQKVIFPSTLTTIGAYAFYDSGVITAELNEGITRICSYAFSKSNINEIVLPDSLTALGSHAFEKSKLTTVTFGNGIDTIPEYCFANTLLTSVTIPAGYKKIDSAAFINCEELSDYYIPSTVKEIVYSKFNTAPIGLRGNGTEIPCRVHCAFNSQAFLYTKKFDNITYVLDYGTESGFDLTQAAVYGEFEDATNRWYYYPETNTIFIDGIGTLVNSKMIFMDGTEFTVEALREYKYPRQQYEQEVKRAKTEENKTLPAWESLDLYIDTVTLKYGIGELKSFSSDGSAFTQINPRNIVLPDSIQKLTGKQFYNCTNLVGIEIPSSVTTISKDSFNGCTNLEFVKIGGGLSEITRDMFASSTKLKYLELASGVKKIGDRAFYRCTNLESVTIPNTVTMIGEQAFYQCYGIKKITIGTAVNYIGAEAFADAVLCEELNINTPKVSYAYSDALSDSKGVFKNIGDSTTGVTVTYGDKVVTANVGVLNNHNISTLVLGKIVENVDNATDLVNLESVVVSSSNTKLSVINDCLYKGTTLYLVPATFTEVDINDNTTTIGTNAFASSLVSSVSLPNGVISIENSAFKNASMLKRIALPKTVLTIGDSAFEKCISLRNINIGENVTHIGANAFKDCVKLPTMILDDKLVSIGSGAFYGCAKLEGLVIPRNVERIGDNAFANCPALENIFLWNAEIGDGNFIDSPDITAWVYVATLPYAYVRENNISYNVYTDEELFRDLCAMNVDIYAGYLGFCDGSHGDIEWLTVYESDCQSDGYMIGVCEYCSEIIEEKHISSVGHNYTLIADIPATEYTSGSQVYLCLNCNERYTTFTPPTEYFAPEMHTVSGRVTIAENKNAAPTNNAISGARIVCDGNVIAVTDKDGNFEVSLDSGVYELTIKYTYGIDRTIFVVVGNSNVDCGTISVVGCDFNKDGVVNNDDYVLFMYVISCKVDDESYLNFVDLNNDGYINAKDRIIVNSCLGIDGTFSYETLVIKA